MFDFTDSYKLGLVFDIKSFVRQKRETYLTVYFIFIKKVILYSEYKLEQIFLSSYSSLRVFLNINEVLYLASLVIFMLLRDSCDSRNTIFFSFFSIFNVRETEYQADGDPVHYAQPCRVRRKDV